MEPLLRWRFIHPMLHPKTLRNNPRNATPATIAIHTPRKYRSAFRLNTTMINATAAIIARIIQRLNPITASTPNNRMATITQSRKTVILVFPKSSIHHFLSPNAAQRFVNRICNDGSLYDTIGCHYDAELVLAGRVCRKRTVQRRVGIKHGIVAPISANELPFFWPIPSGTRGLLDMAVLATSNQQTNEKAVFPGVHALKSVTVGFLPVREETPKLKRYRVKTNKYPPSLMFTVFPNQEPESVKPPFAEKAIAIELPDTAYVPLRVSEVGPDCPVAVRVSVKVPLELNVTLPDWSVILPTCAGSGAPPTLRNVYVPKMVVLGAVASPPHAAIALHNNPRPNQRPVFIAIPSEHGGDPATAAKQAALISRPPDPTVRERAPKHAGVADVTPFSGNSVALAQSSEGQNQDARRDQQQGAHAQESIPSGFLETPADLGDLCDQFLRLPFVHRGALRQCERQTSHFSGGLVTKDVPNWRIAA